MKNQIRTTQVERQTSETHIQISLNLDGSGQAEIHTGIGFLDHMLNHLALHGLFDLILSAQGDLEVDAHHTVEDVALALGEAFARALGERQGIARMASAYVPMDESLAFVAVDFSGRPYTVMQVEWHTPAIGALPTSLINHFMESFAGQARANLHIRVLYGRDDHHQAEAIFKALGRALDAATRIDPRRAGQIPSTKELLSNMASIWLVDAGTGNLHSVYNALRFLGAEVTLTCNPADLRLGGAVILPGVGAFGKFMQGLIQQGLVDALREVVRRGDPLFGICVGMQALFTASEEMGEFPGLDILSGRVLRFPESTVLKVPHTGWNQLLPTQASALLRNLTRGDYVYFNHSYYCAANPTDTIAVTEYGSTFASMVQHDNVYGVQFHPEKSQRVGLKILRNFIELAA